MGGGRGGIGDVTRAKEIKLESVQASNGRGGEENRAG